MTDPVVPTPKPVKRNAEQDQRIANQIAADGQYLETVRTDPEISVMLAQRGYTALKLADGDALQVAAQAAFTQRQTAMAGQGHASAGLSGRTAEVREMYKDFRDTVRAISDFTAADRLALKVNGTIPADRQKMITAARASFQAAQAPTYAATLALYGYSSEVIGKALEQIDAYAAADVGQNSAIGDATRATADRNAAYTALQTYMKQLRRIANVALRQRPDLLKKLAG